MTLISQITPAEIKERLSLSTVLKYYGGECTSLSSGAWWCIMHEAGGKESGHKTPSLVAKDERGTATCMSRQCFDGDDIFGIIAKMERFDIKNDFARVLAKACDIAGISYNNEPPIKSNNLKAKKIITDLEPKHLEYLNNIGISQKVAFKFGLKARYDYILYPQLENAIPLGYKGISIIKDQQTSKSKQFFEDYTAPLFHELSPKKGKNIIFTEGEKDCLRLTEAILEAKAEEKFMAVTITTGAKTVPSNILQKLKKLNPSDIYILYDNDEAGVDGSKKLASTLVLSHLLKSIRIFDILKEMIDVNNAESRPKINEVFQES